MTEKDLTSLFDLDGSAGSGGEQPVLVSALDSPPDAEPILSADLSSPGMLPAPVAEIPAIDLSPAPPPTPEPESEPTPEPENIPEPTEFRAVFSTPEPPEPTALKESSTSSRTVYKPSIPKTSEAFEVKAVGSPSIVQAEYPFSLKIDGQLKVTEREKLLELLARENVGIRDIDLEVQFESGKVLIPRISEYAGVLIVQALRGISAEISLGPSDSIFSTPDTSEEAPRVKPKFVIESHSHEAASVVEEAAEKIQITHLPALPGFAQFEAVDAVVASAAIRTSAVEANKSREYAEALEALKRELRHRAYHRGATAIVGFEVNLISLSLPTHYRLTLTGTAIKSTERK